VYASLRCLRCRRVEDGIEAVRDEAAGV